MFIICFRAVAPTFIIFMSALSVPGLVTLLHSVEKGV